MIKIFSSRWSLTKIARAFALPTFSCWTFALSDIQIKRTPSIFLKKSIKIENTFDWAEPLELDRVQQEESNHVIKKKEILKFSSRNA